MVCSPLTMAAKHKKNSPSEIGLGLARAEEGKKSDSAALRERGRFLCHPWQAPSVS